MIWLAALQFAVAIGAGICVRTAQPNRTYWPMVRVMFGVVAAVYGGAAINTLGGWTGQMTTRVAFTLFFLGGVVHAIWFIRKRNRTARFLGLNLGGDIIVTPVEDLERAATLVESWAHHGAMTPERAANLKAALAKWDGHQAWKAGIVSQARERRARKGGEHG